MSNKFEKDLTQGNVWRQLLVFAAPFVLSNFIQSLYSVCDMIILGKFTDVATLTGVSNATQLTMLFTNAVIGLSVGGTVLIGQFLGVGDKERVKRTIGTTFTLLILIGLAFTVILPFFGRPLLTAMQVSEASMKAGVDYYVICLLGTLFVFAYNALAAVMRGLGDSKHPMLFVAIAAAVNIVLDLVLVGKLGMSSMGAALATIISQAISVILCVTYLVKNDFIFDFRLSSFRIDRGLLATIWKIGFPTMLNNICTSLSFVFLMVVANTVDPSGGGAVGVVGKYNGFAILPAVGISSAISAMVAQNIGAGEVDRVKKTFRAGLIMAELFSLVIFTFSQLFPEVVLGMFSDDETFIRLGCSYLALFSFDYIIVPIQFSFNGLFIGTGHTKFALISGVCASLLFRIPFCWLLGIFMDFGMSGVGAGAPIASLAASCISFGFFLTGAWKSGAVEKKKA